MESRTMVLMNLSAGQQWENRPRTMVLMNLSAGQQWENRHRE